MTPLEIGGILAVCLGLLEMSKLLIKKIGKPDHGASTNPQLDRIERNQNHMVESCREISFACKAITKTMDKLEGRIDR